jgi:hypothetical protein
MEPERIISLAVLARRLSISRAALSKHVRRGIVSADFKSSAGSFFRYDRIQDAKRAIEHNRNRNYKHLGRAI